MKKLTEYELANIAAWAFDFESATRLFKHTTRVSVRRKDVLGAEGALELASISDELSAGNWSSTIQKPQGQDSFLDDVLTVEMPGTIADTQWRGPVAEVLTKMRHEITKRMRRNKKRLLLAKMLTGIDVGRHEHQVGYLSAGPYGVNWFVTVQTLSFFCIGRAYRRDGYVSDLEALTKLLHVHNLQTGESDDRCLQVLFEGFVAEVWFDGRVSIIAVASQHDNVEDALRRIADESDIAIG